LEEIAKYVDVYFKRTKKGLGIMNRISERQHERYTTLTRGNQHEVNEKYVAYFKICMAYTTSSLLNKSSGFNFVFREVNHA
jgi:hypothetical protein